MLFLFEKSRHGDEHISINLPVEEAQKSWRIRQFAMYIIVQLRMEFSLLWKRALTEDGEATLQGRLHCYYRGLGNSGGFSIQSIPHETVMQNIDNDVPIYLMLLPRSRLCRNPLFHPRKRKSPSHNKSTNKMQLKELFLKLKKNKK